MDPALYRQLQLNRITGNTGTTEFEIQYVTSICLVSTKFNHYPSKCLNSSFFQLSLDILILASHYKIMPRFIPMVAIHT
jgi:hypothetical protein